MDQFEPEINGMVNAVIKVAFGFCFFLAGMFLGIAYVSWRLL